MHFYNFLWKSKRNKVKRQIVTQEILKGCLEMLDINNFVCSSKCSYIKMLTLNYKPRMCISIVINGSDVVSGILDLEDSFIKRMIKQINIFWQDVLQSWPQVENIKNKNLD